ncbi:MAG: hypothetical protein K8T89_10225 [Planctomycetes bacterium]|nr:hypothetical protein [Planctomycetota bacterium]
MNHSNAWTCVLIAALFTPGLGLGQTFSKDWPRDVIGLLREPSVQKEIKLTAAQLKEFNALVQKELGDAKIDLQLGAKQSTVGGKVLESLEAKQQERLEQIFWQRVFQVDGLRVFSEPSILKKLEFDAEQTKSLNSALTESQTREQEFTTKFNKQPGGNEQTYDLALSKMRMQVAAKFQSQFTATQKATWKGIVGAPFAGKFTNMYFRPTR